MRGNVAADTTVKLNRPCAVERQPDIFEHLAIAHLDHDEELCMHGEALQMQLRKWEERDGAKYAYLETVVRASAATAFNIRPRIP